MNAGERFWDGLKRFLGGCLSLGGIIVICLILLFPLFWMLFLNHVDINEIGVAYNSWNGEVTVQDEPGWYITNPLTLVASISTLPRKVDIPSNAVVVNAKVVRFKKEGVQEYIRLQGFQWFLSDKALDNILMGYAFSGKDFPFLEIIQESGPENLSKPHGDWRRVSDGPKEKTSDGK